MSKSKNTIKVISPAKVNLFLAVGDKGKGVEKDVHPVLNIMHSLILHDNLFISYEPSDKLNISINILENEDINNKLIDIPLNENLVYKAIKLLAKKTKQSTKYNIDIIIEKNIPIKAGLAGGSSNAAAALIGAAKIFGLKKDAPEILECAKDLGSDIAFFIDGGCALYSGKGEILDHKIQPINREVLILLPIPNEGLSTKDVYSHFDKINVASDFDKKFEIENDNKHHCHDDNCKNHNHENHNHLNYKSNMSLRESLSEIIYADNVPLFNNLALASEQLMPQLLETKQWLIDKVGEENVLLCGSGSATFAIVPDELDAEELAKEAKQNGYCAICTQLANVKSRIVPVTQTF